LIQPAADGETDDKANDSYDGGDDGVHLFPPDHDDGE
jgi:hypothetical protein